MERLIAGFRRFRHTLFSEHRDTFATLAEHGQSPKALVVACCDSRVDPQMILGAMPGDIFVIRNVANLVPPYEPSAEYHGTSAALEFGIKGLEVEHIIVLGHAGCGGIRALLQGTDKSETDFIGPWVRIAADARERVLGCGCGHLHGDPQRALELEAIKTSLDNLMTFPWIRERVEAGKLRLHGWFFALDNGELLYLDPASRQFLTLPPVEDDDNGEVDTASQSKALSE